MKLKFLIFLLIVFIFILDCTNDNDFTPDKEL